MRMQKAVLSCALKGVVSSELSYPFYFDHKFTKSIFSDFILKLLLDLCSEIKIDQILKEKINEPNQVLQNLCKMQGEYLKTSGRCFQIGIHFNLGYA